MPRCTHAIQQGLALAITMVFCGGLCSCRALSPERPVPLSSYDDQVKILLDQMTLDEKIGQMTQADQEHLKDLADIKNYYLGSLLSGGDSDPAAGNSLEQWTDMVDRYQEVAMQTRLHIPILYGVDAVHGHSNVLGAVIFPHNIGLGCTRNAKLVEDVSRITAQEMRATGIQWAFAPCVTVPRDDRWGRTFEGFAEDPALVSRLGQAAVRGLQGNDLSDPHSVIACAKHYIADGGTTAVLEEVRRRRRLMGDNYGGEGVAGRRGYRVRLDQGNSEMTEEQLRAIHLPPYVAAIDAGVTTIMPSYSSWNGVKCSASKRLLTEILKDELGFEGFLISDYCAINQVHPDYKTAIGICINAGMDMGMVPRQYREFCRYLKELVEEGVVPMSRIDDAVTRILRVKVAMGLLDPERSQQADRELWGCFGSEEHRQVARQAVRESLVLLKNDQQVLPLNKQVKRIHVVGESADNLGDQCGGWTIRWQGQRGEVTPGGTTVLAALKQTVSADTVVTYAADGTGADGADVVVAVVGETPYAEGNGDSADLRLSSTQEQVVERASQAGVPVVVILLSGRPLIIDSVLEQSDALVAAWLPGTEGAGLTDVLFGDYRFTGKLSFTWPKTADQEPINVGDQEDEPLFDYGYGLEF